MALDFATVLKISQHLSSTIQLHDLLPELTQVVLQNSGGDRCVLILPTPRTDADGEWRVRAIATPSETQLCSSPLDHNPNLPVKLIQHVKNTQEVVVIHDLETHLPVMDDYFRTIQPKSVLCLPIVNQQQVIGILYLINHSISHVFTGDRILVLNFLCTQAAISLENARLFHEIKQAEINLQQSKAFLEAQRDSSLDGILVVDQNRIINAYNQRFVELWAVPLELQNNPDDHLMLAYAVNQLANPEVFLEEVLYLYDHIHETSHCELLFKDGRIIERSSVPVNSSTGENWGRIWYFRDITERKHAETAIRQKSQELEQALQELQQAQLQMIQSEKMSALGNLVAGVAHEINNPVGCVIGNINVAQDYINDLLGVIDLYAKKYPQPEAEIEAELETIDLDYIREDLPKLIQAMKNGGDRIKAISQSLRSFSRSDSDIQQKFNVHEGIESTVLILRHRLKANEHRPAIEVITDYGDLPEIDCFPGQLNQVFMNILANAIDALDDSNQGKSFIDIEAHPNRITIHTALEENQIIITIADNGKGMQDDIKNRIFDHLFTTKGVSQGTGLGLAIARQIIVEKHGGAIAVNSALGQGTEFIIRLPVELKSDSQDEENLEFGVEK